MVVKQNNAIVNQLSETSKAPSEFANQSFFFVLSQKKTLTIFQKNSIVDAQMGSKLATS